MKKYNFKETLEYAVLCISAGAIVMHIHSMLHNPNDATSDTQPKLTKTEQVIPTDSVVRDSVVQVYRLRNLGTGTKTR